MRLTEAKKFRAGSNNFRAGRGLKWSKTPLFYPIVKKALPPIPQQCGDGLGCEGTVTASEVGRELWSLWGVHENLERRRSGVLVMRGHVRDRGRSEAVRAKGPEGVGDVGGCGRGGRRSFLEVRDEGLTVGADEELGRPRRW